MSALFYPHRHHNRSFGSHHNLASWSRPSSFAVSPFHVQQSQYDSDPFGFSEPFLSLFNDTFNQLDELSSDLTSHSAQTFGSSDHPTAWQNLLTSTPKFDVKETDAAYVLEGELPGITKPAISLTWADEHTLVLKTQTNTFTEQKPITSDVPTPKSTNPNDVENSPTEAITDAAKSSNTENSDSAITKTDHKSTDVAKPAPASPTYHLTERTHSTFQRVFSFAGQVEHDGVKASLKNGVLTVTVPKVNPEPAEEQRKHRSVTVEDADEAEDAEMADAEKANL